MAITSKQFDLVLQELLNIPYHVCCYNITPIMVLLDLNAIKPNETSNAVNMLLLIIAKGNKHVELQNHSNKSNYTINSELGKFSLNR